MKVTWSKIALSLGFIASSAFINFAHAANLVGINSNNQIGVFNSNDLANASFVNISGLAQGESLIGIDLRPSNNTIYGISSANKIYTLNANTGVASSVATLSGYSINTGLGYGFDFNPAADFSGAPSLRLVSSAGDNLAVNVNTGLVGNQANTIASGFSAVAYTNSSPNGPLAAPALYYLNSTTDTLHLAPGAFNAPFISLVGELGIDIIRANGFELFADGTALAAVNINDGDLRSVLLSIDLISGKATNLGSFVGTLNGLAGAPSAVPVPAAAWLFGSALLGLAGLRRKFV